MNWCHLHVHLSPKLTFQDLVINGEEQLKEAPCANVLVIKLEVSTTRFEHFDMGQQKMP